jgi:hypothetical protein
LFIEAVIRAMSASWEKLGVFEWFYHRFKELMLDMFDVLERLVVK